MTVSRFLRPGMSRVERGKVLDIWEWLLSVAGWRISGWPAWIPAWAWNRKRSMTIPLFRRIYFGDDVSSMAVGAHEMRHAERMDGVGHFLWLLKYSSDWLLMGLVLSALARTVGLAVNQMLVPAVWLGAAALAVVLFVWVVRRGGGFRLQEELEGYAVQVAMLAALAAPVHSTSISSAKVLACVNVPNLHSNRWPYLISQSEEAVVAATLRRAIELLEAAGWEIEQ